MSPYTSPAAYPDSAVMLVYYPDLRGFCYWRHAYNAAAASWGASSRGGNYSHSTAPTMQYKYKNTKSIMIAVARAFVFNAATIIFTRLTPFKGTLFRLHEDGFEPSLVVEEGRIPTTEPNSHPKYWVLRWVLITYQFSNHQVCCIRSYRNGVAGSKSDHISKDIMINRDKLVRFLCTRQPPHHRRPAQIL